MTTIEELQTMEGQNAVDRNGAKIGKVGHIYVDDQTGQPLWVTLITGMLGTKQSFAPLYGSRTSDGNLQLAVSKDMVSDAPDVEATDHIEDSENDDLHTYYREYLGGAAQDTSGPTTDEAMTRSEERLHVGTEQVEAGRARLRKYVVTENVTQTIPVSHEEVRLEREPITDANRGAAMSGSDISEEEHEVTLRAERPVVAKETVPVERVRLGTETVTTDHQVSESVRKEQIDDVETTGTADGGRL